jgi:hypothetical protein
LVNDKTLQAFKEAGVDYQYKGIDEHLRNERDKTSLDDKKQRKINSMYRFRTDEAKEYLLYEQDVTTISNVTRNRIQWHEAFAETSMYFVPIVERQNRYDQETEKQTSEVRQIAAIETHYLIPFTEEEVSKIKPFANLATKYYIWQQDGLISSINDFDDWLKIPFATLIAGPDAIEQYKIDREDEEEEQKQQQEAALKPKVSK